MIPRSALSWREIRLLQRTDIERGNEIIRGRYTTDIVQDTTHDIITANRKINPTLTPN